MSFKEAEMLDPQVRQAFLLVMVEAEGNEIDWETGAVKSRRKDGHRASS
jgi:hypothetical protein